jgi:predicted helicase
MPTPTRGGKQFERFVKWFLTTEPEWSTQVDKVWLWDEYPGRWGRDCGIDLVFKHRNGQTWAVQAKCYSPAYEITKSDVDKFLSETNRKGIDHRLLIATTDRLGTNAKQVSSEQLCRPPEADAREGDTGNGLIVPAAALRLAPLPASLCIPGL